MLGTCYNSNMKTKKSKQTNMNPKRKNILLVNDFNNVEADRNYVDALRQGHSVDATGYISTARIKLAKDIERNGKITRYDLAVLAVGMPTLGDFSREETNGGWTTGLVYFEKELKDLNLPTLFWSRDKDDKQRMEEMIKENKLDPTKVKFTHKNSDDTHLLRAVENFFHTIERKKDTNKTGSKLQTLKLKDKQPTTTSKEPH